MNPSQALMVGIGAFCTIVTLSSVCEILFNGGWYFAGLTEPLRAASAVVLVISTIMWPSKRHG